MTCSVQSSTESGYLMIDHVSGLIAEASRLHEQARECAAANDRTAAANLSEQAASLASIAVSFRYDLADAHADTKDADDLIAMLDKWAAKVERARAVDDEHGAAVTNSVFLWATE